MIKQGLLFSLLLLFTYSRGEYVLVWSDEFDGTTLDRCKWDIESDCWGGGNFEKQCYTPLGQNVYLRDGCLILQAIPQEIMGNPFGCTNNNENSCTWTHPTSSGSIRTRNSPFSSFKYGRFEASMKLPKGDFLWPAFWMLPTDSVYGEWANSGEIDIMEFRGQDRSVVVNTIHFGKQWPENTYISSDKVDTKADLTEDFHVYALEWTPTEMIWYMDDIETFRTELKLMHESYDHEGAPFDKRFYIKLNLAVGGGFFDKTQYGEFDVERDAKTWESPRFEIDYVRVYQDTEHVEKFCDRRDEIVLKPFEYTCSCMSYRAGTSDFTDQGPPVEPPVKPETPVEPPVEPETPVEPPVKPETPVEPPVEPETPVEPPVEPENPSGSCPRLGNTNYMMESRHGYSIVTSPKRPNMKSFPSVFSYGNSKFGKKRMYVSLSPSMNAYMTFRIDTVKTIKTATLSVYCSCNIPKAGISLYLYPMGHQFEDATRMNINSLEHIADAAVSREPRWIKMDISDAVKRMYVSGSTTISLVMATMDRMNVVFMASSESSYSPVLTFGH